MGECGAGIFLSVPPPGAAAVLQLGLFVRSRNSARRRFSASVGEPASVLAEFPAVKTAATFSLSLIGLFLGLEKKSCVEGIVDALRLSARTFQILVRARARAYHIFCRSFMHAL